MEWTVKTLFLYTILLACTDMTKAENENKAFYVMMDLEMQNALSVFTQSSKLRCGRLCSQRSGCLSFSFSPSQEICKLFGSDPLVATSDSSTAIGSMLYVRDCEIGWLKFRESCYKFSTIWKSWVDSKADCESIGASLAKVTNEAEHQFIRQTAAGTQQSYFWIGGRYNIATSKFEWTDGSAISFHGWRPSLPTNDAGCADYMEAVDWLWNQHWDCHTTYIAYICEKPRI